MPGCSINFYRNFPKITPEREVYASMLSIYIQNGILKVNVLSLFRAKDITKQLTPLREQNKITDRIERRAPDLQRMLVLERGLELQAYTQQKNQRNIERSQ